MNIKIAFKLLLIITSLFLQFNLQAQQWENVTSKFDSWQIDNELVVYSKSLTQLQVENVDAVSEISKKNNAIDFLSVTMNLNLKENNPFQITFDLTNANNDPYRYKYKVYEKDKKGKLKEKWHKDNIYWGIYVELYGLDGSIVTHKSWSCAKAGNYGTVYSMNKNNGGWIDYLGIMNSVIIKKDESNTCYIGDVSWKHIAGIKSITFMIGCAAKISVNNFSVSRKKSEPKIINSSQNISNRQEQQSFNNNSNIQQLIDNYLIQGRSYSNQNNHTQAIACCKKVLELNPNNYWANNNIGYEYLLTEEYTLGIPYLKKAIEIEPDNPFAYSNIGGICVCLGEYNKAIDYCQKAIGIKDKYNANLQGRTPFNFGEPYYYLGLAYAGLNDWEKALSHIVEAAQLGDSKAQELLKDIEKNTNSSSQQKTKPSNSGLKKDPNFKIK